MHPIFAQDLLHAAAPTTLRREHMAEVEARHAELRRLEASIDAVTELHGEFELFLATQQERIEEIILNATGTEECLRAGNREISRAIVYRQRSRKRWVWVMGGVVVLAGLLALLTYLALTGRFGGAAMIKG
jgi:syntaxin 1B/2/3